jgi:hypothetical protein
MEYRSLKDVSSAAFVADASGQLPQMSRVERLARWIAILEASPERELGTLPGTEYVPRAQRADMWAGSTALSLAYADPVLRAAGLDGDSYGAARAFFGLSHNDMHRVTCHCLNGSTISAGVIAKRLRPVLGKWQNPGLAARAWSWLSGSTRTRDGLCGI